MTSSGSFLHTLGTILGQTVRAVLRRGQGSTSTSTGDRAGSTPAATPASTRQSSSVSGTRERARTNASTGASGRAGAEQRESESVAWAAELAARERLAEGEHSPGQLGASATFEVVPPTSGALTIAYEPDKDGEPDAGEVVWTWIPYDERDGRGKDRPVLIVARDAGERFYAVRLTSKEHDGDRQYLEIGAGAWDSQGRSSWVDIEQLYSVHSDGMRREAATLDRDRFAVVAAALRERYGWQRD